MGVIALIIGVGTLVNWWFVMFSDCWYADFQRDLSKAWFDLGRNTESLITPAAGMMMLVGGFLAILDELFPDNREALKYLAAACVICLGVVVLGLIPFRWPGPMYPEWQLERRRRRAQEAARASCEHEAGGGVPRGRHAAPPETATGAGGRYAQYAGDAGGEDPLKSGDSLPMRARSPHDDISGPRGGENV
ncbi:hypothetical protein [Actinomyces oris]